MNGGQNIASLTCFMMASTLPFHLFAYVPFWNSLRLPKKTTFWLLIATQTLFMGIFFTLYQAGLSLELAQLPAIPLYGGLFFYFVKMDAGKVAFLYIFTADYLMLVKGTAAFLGRSIFHFPAVSWQSGAVILLIFFVTMPFMLRYIRQTARIIFLIEAPGIWKTVWMVPLFTSIIVLLYTYPAETGSLLTLATRTLLMICMFLIYRNLVRSIQLLQQQTIAEERSRSMNELIKIQTSQYALVQSRLEETRHARHDLRHHWQALHGYINCGDLNALSAYVKKYGESLPQEALPVYCGNAAINAILCFYAKKASQYAIDLEISFAIRQKTVIPEPEFCVILGNLLENALDACTTCGKTRFIKIRAKQMSESTLVLTVDNTGPKPEKQGDAFYSSKRPGFGLSTESVRIIVQRYHGDVRYEWKEGVFYASVMLTADFPSGTEDHTSSQQI